MSADEGSGPNSVQRIDMGHGFMKSVIKNQIDRDNYDKETKAKQTKGKPHNRPRRQKKPELPTYMIPSQRSKIDGGDESEVLFCLEYQHDNGDIMKLNVMRADQAKQVARRIGAKYDLPEMFVTALTQRLQQEMNVRTDPNTSD